MADVQQQISDALATARSQGQPVYISAGNSKRDLLGRAPQGVAELSLRDHSGVVEFEPSELYITARAGTPVRELREVLAGEGLCLPFEPAEFDGQATIGGTVACNLAGPARPWSGAVRDAVLGIRMLNGKGQDLQFGGRVMKNVAGYDVSRLQAGALGTLGVLLEITLKLSPLPQYSATLALPCQADTALGTMARCAREAKPLSGATWIDGTAYLRLSGNEPAVKSTTAAWEGDIIDEASQPWTELREFNHPFMSGDEPLWRASLKPTAALASATTLIDWGGAQRWYRAPMDAREQLEQHAHAGGGHLTLFRGGDRQGEVRGAASAVEQRLQQRLKHSFDPDGLLNPGRLYSWM